MQHPAAVGPAQFPTTLTTGVACGGYWGFSPLGPVPGSWGYICPGFAPGAYPAPAISYPVACAYFGGQHLNPGGPVSLAEGWGSTDPDDVSGSPRQLTSICRRSTSSRSSLESTSGTQHRPGCTIGAPCEPSATAAQADSDGTVGGQHVQPSHNTGDEMANSGPRVPEVIHGAAPQAACRALEAPGLEAARSPVYPVATLSPAPANNAPLALATGRVHLLTLHGERALVNARRYNAILRRRQQREKLRLLGPVNLARKACTDLTQHDYAVRGLGVAGGHSLAGHAPFQRHATRSAGAGNAIGASSSGADAMPFGGFGARRPGGDTGDRGLPGKGLLPVKPGALQLLTGAARAALEAELEAVLAEDSGMVPCSSVSATSVG